MLVLGHRGSRRPGPDNSSSAVAGALAAGADGVEVDLRRVPDGRLLLSHDPVVAGVVLAEAHGARLAGLELDDLPAVLDLARGRGRVVCEVKNAPGEPDHDATGALTVARLDALLRSRVGGGTADAVTVSSFDPLVVAVARDAGLRTGLLTRPGVTVAAGLAQATAGGHPELHVHVTSLRLDRHAVRRAVDAGVDLVAWTVTRTASARRMAAAGVAAVIVDDPAAVCGALRR